MKQDINEIKTLLRELINAPRWNWIRIY
jgi:hypothetical protein